MAPLRSQWSLSLPVFGKSDALLKGFVCELGAIYGNQQVSVHLGFLSASVMPSCNKSTEFGSFTRTSDRTEVQISGRMRSTTLKKVRACATI